MASTPEEPVAPTKPNSRQRFKPQLSCTFCRTRKLKCDRAFPCENCVKRNLGSSCTYIHASLTKDKSQVQKNVQVPKDVHNQVRRLEELVISLMNETNKNGSSGQGRGQVTPASSSSSQDLVSGIEVENEDNDGAARLKDTAVSLGKITIGEGDRASYVGSAHWTAILDNIAGLKDQLEIVEEVREEKQNVLGPDLLVGSVKPASRAEIMASLPPKEVTDRLVERLFQASDMGSSMIHRPTFMKEYARFWAKPRSALIMWIGQLYGILTLSIFFENATNSPSSLVGLPLQDPSEAMTLYAERTIQCLILGNYTDPGPYTVETLWMYYVYSQFRSKEPIFGSWLVFSLLIRAAMRLGYHRDASHFPNISAYQGEMQRRLWAGIVHLDLQTSLQVGLPRMIREGMYDTQPPRNLLDEDFSDDSTALPPSRPDDELTAVGCANIKHRITRVLGVIVDQANWTSPISYDMVMKLDKQLHDVYLKTPPSLRANSINDLLHGSPAQRWRKATIDLTFQKSRCILHRRFFFPSKITGQYPYPYSMKSCIDAAMRILQMQLLMHEECRPGRTLYDHRWMTSSLLSQDFLLAGMLICLHIGHGVSGDRNTLEQEALQLDGNGIRIRWTQAEMLQSLRDSCRIWEEVGASSKEAIKAVRTLKAMVAKVEQQSLANFSCGISSTGPDTSTRSVMSNSGTVGAQTSLSSSWVPVGPVVSPLFEASPAADSDLQPSFDNMGFETLDWELWDSHAYNSSLDNVSTNLWSFDSSFTPLDQGGQF